MKKNLFILLLSALTLSQHLAAQCSPVPYTVPYLETFSSLTANDQLPSCWVASSMGSSCHTYSAMQCAGFYDYPTGNSSFYSPAIHLNAGTVYSASITYSTSSYSSNGSSWAQLALLMSPYAMSSNYVTLASLYSVSSTVTAVLSNTLTVSSSGSYELIIRVTSTTGLITNLYFDNVSITEPCSLNPVPVAIHGPTLGCVGATSTLTATGATSYTWTDGQNITTASAIAISPSVNTTYTVIGGTNQCTNTAMVTFSVNPQTIPTISVSSTNSFICTGETATLTASGAGTYTWQGSGTPQNGQQLIASPLVTTTYTITGDTAGCVNSSTFAENVSICTGLNTEKTIEDLKIYPNPSHDIVNVQWTNNTDVTMEVMDISGRVITAAAGTGTTAQINLTGFANGLYYLKMQFSDSVRIVKLMKQ